jgi:hypothetical protein
VIADNGKRPALLIAPCLLLTSHCLLLTNHLSPVTNHSLLLRFLLFKISSSSLRCCSWESWILARILSYSSSSSNSYSKTCWVYGLNCRSTKETGDSHRLAIRHSFEYEYEFEDDVVVA